MEPQIRYARTTDGVNIAFTDQGEGRPLVSMAGWPFTHLRAEWSVPTYRMYFETLAARCRLIRFDGRGSGLSERNPQEITSESFIRDLEAVVNRLDVDEFDLNAFGYSGSAAVVYTSRNLERVRRLILWGSSPQRAGDLARTPRMAALIEMMYRDWELFTETIAQLFFGWSAGDPARRFAEFLREAVAPETAARVLGALFATIAGDLVTAVNTPTLVMHNRASPMATVDMVTELTALMPNATLALLDGTWMTTEEEARGAANLILEFVTSDDGRWQPEEITTGTMATATGTAVILFTDIVSSTELTERMGDVAFRDASRALDAGLRAAIRDAGGAAIDGKLLGDGVLATFPSAAQAIDGARRCLTLSTASELGLHIGLHAGDVIREDNNVYGGAVNIASRICGLSAPGEILVSDVVRGMARSSAGVEFEDRGEQEMKGVGEPVRVYAVRRRD
jgi:class 3 adenylate cyclase